jgi:hypothetical protein
MGNTKRKQTNKRRKNRKTRTIRKKNKGGGCGCGKAPINLPPMKGGYGKASFQPFEQTAGTYSYPVNNYNSDPNMPTTMSSGRLSMPVLRGGKRKSIRHKKMKGGDLLLGNNSQILPLSLGTSGGSMAGVNVLTGYGNNNTNAYSQPISQKFGTNNPPMA